MTEGPLLPQLSPAWAFHLATSNPPWAYPPQASAAGSGDVVELPEPQPLHASLDEALAGRASCRRFSPSALSGAELSAVLRAGYGVTGHASVEGFEFDTRPVPSAGAKYPLEVCLLALNVDGVEPAAYAYLPARHGLRRTSPAVPATDIVELFLGQPYLAGAGAVLVLAGAPSRTMARYGDRGYRYVLFEAGHVAQNLILAARAVGLGSLNLGGFYDQALAELLGLQGTDQVPLYGLAVGRPLAGDPRDPVVPSTS